VEESRTNSPVRPDGRSARRRGAAAAGRTRRAQRADRSIWRLSAATGLGAAALWLLVSPRGVDAGVALHPLLVVSLFALSEVAAVHLWVRGEAHTKSLSEVPLVVGLYALAPSHLLLSAIAGVCIALAGFRRQRGAKLAFNLAQVALQVVVALATFEVLVSRGAPLAGRSWPAAIVAALAAEFASSVLVSFALWMHTRSVDLGALVRAELAAVPACVASASVGVLASLSLAGMPSALVLLGTVVVTTVAAYRGYGSLLRRHRHLQQLQEYGRTISAAVAHDDVTPSALRGAAELLGATRAYILLLVPDRPGHVWRARYAAGDVRSGVEALDPADPIAAVLGSGEPVHIRRHGAATQRRTSLAHLGIGELLAAPLRADGAVVGVLAVANDAGNVDAFDRNDLALFVTLCDQTALTLQNGRLLSALRAEIEERERRALHDDVTGLGNRAALLEELGERCRNDPAPVAVAIIGLERFGAVNEALGYERGDEVLRSLADRLRRRLRLSDLLARLTGGEFAVVFDEVADEEAARCAIGSLLDSIAEPIPFGGIEVALGACAGVALRPQHGDDPAQLLRRADAAYRVAKDARRSVEIFDEQRDHDAAGRLLLATQLRHAIEREELTVVYQPKCDLRDGMIRGVEALVRWEHPERGHIPPDEFVQLAEQTGSIHALTAFVFRRALADRRRWAEKGLDLSLSVNVSARDLDHDWLVREVPGLLSMTGCPPTSLTLEITETQLMADVERARAAITPLHELGVRIAIDDYGTGYSSLAVLRALPLSEIKIDKSFVLDMRADDNDAVVVRSTVQLGQALGLEVVAEGVETTVSWQLLCDWSCDRAQGYLIARPTPPDKIPAIIEAWRVPDAAAAHRIPLRAS
jgi:diguanylate cyclase (GGDEF)-like protein